MHIYIYNIYILLAQRTYFSGGGRWGELAICVLICVASFALPFVRNFPRFPASFFLRDRETKLIFPGSRFSNSIVLMDESEW